MKSKNYIGIVILALFLLLGLSSGIALAQTGVSVSPATQTISKGDPFTVDITISPDTPIVGAQFDLSFDTSLASANGVTEGNLLKQDGASTFFQPGTVDNAAGTITGVAGAIIGKGAPVSSPDVFATISFIAKTTAGTSPLDLSNVIVGDINGDPVSITVNSGSFTATSEGSEMPKLPINATPPPSDAGVGGDGDTIISPTPTPTPTISSLTPKTGEVPGFEAFIVVNSLLVVACAVLRRRR
jgi:hypothetical protein